ncbi:MAG: PfaD family polyunsaturated fatty acid/polyketide biosynthesis protein [bacterium]|nr:PfaD family polyunsaturated fatty acid/polyketide biosynthesis protein [bacterium]
MRGGSLVHPSKAHAPTDAGATRSVVGRLRSDCCSVPTTGPEGLKTIQRTDAPAWVVATADGHRLVECDDAELLGSTDGGGVPIVGLLPACPPEKMGGPAFREEHGLRYAYYAGAMANGIASPEVVEAAGNNGFLGFFGSAGLPLKDIEAAIDTITSRLGSQPFGFNLINNLSEPQLEEATVDLYIRRGIHLIEAAAYLDLTLPLVRYRIHGIHTDASGRIITPNKIIAKVSREEVAAKFFSPPPEALVKKLVASGDITAQQAVLAADIPMAQDVTAEADSGGHTDNRPAITLLPTLMALRDRIHAEHRCEQRPRVGLAGGISTPASAAAAFAMGAAYVVTGSVNQACIESGSSDIVRKMLAETRQADLAMAPSADMFEMGVTVQVLKRGTMFSMRAAKLYELYQTYGGIDEIPNDVRTKIEKTIFRASLEETWQNTRKFFMERDASQINRAEKEPRHRMALVFRSYLGLASQWANNGDPTRQIDYQIWCGPAMGAFNEWVRGSFLEDTSNRKVATVALNILHGAAVSARCNILRCMGVSLPSGIEHFAPVEPNRLRRNEVD